MAFVEAAIADAKQYGVKGMHWGVRKDRSGGVPPGETRVTQTKPGGKISTAGGKSVPASEDALRAAKARQVARGSGTHALSNKELQDLVTRLNLEQQYERLATQKRNKGADFVTKTLKNVAKQQVQSLAQEAISKQVASAIKK